MWFVTSPINMIPSFLKQILERIYAHAFHITSQAFTSFGTLSLSLHAIKGSPPYHKPHPASSPTDGWRPYYCSRAIASGTSWFTMPSLTSDVHFSKSLITHAFNIYIYIYVYIYNTYSHVSYDSTGPLSLAALLQIQGNHVPDELVHHAFSHISVGLSTNVLTTNPGQSRPGRVGSPCLLSHLTRTHHKRPH